MIGALSESVVEEAALSWFRELGYAVEHAPHLAPVSSGSAMTNPIRISNLAQHPAKWPDTPRQRPVFGHPGIYPTKMAGYRYPDNYPDILSGLPDAP